MSRLLSVQSMAQQVASAVSTVLNIETMILDSSLKIIAGTGKYMEQIGQKEAEAFVEDEYLYRYLLKNGGFYVVDDTSDPLYGPVQYGETGEICCAIHYNGENVGIISLVAFSNEQYEVLIGNHRSICAFLQNMATLISSYLGNQESLDRISIQKEQLMTTINSSLDGILFLTAEGLIAECNKNAVKIIGLPREEIIGRNIDMLWPNSFAQFISAPDGFSNREYAFSGERVHNHVLLSARPITYRQSIENVIIFFKDIVEAKQDAYRLTGNHPTSFDSIHGTSSQITALKEFAATISHSNSTILITGESGTGKEMFARAIHNSSPRGNAPFVAINCGAIPDNLMESELFGYVEGAFTGAAAGGHKGKFEAAKGGTVFIDEIGDLALHLQVKLLHVLQRRQIEKVGGTNSIDIDVRVIAATNKDLYKMCKTGAFREDLYYRLNVIPLHVPPLRDRLEDVVALSHHFLAKYSMLVGKPITAYSEDALHALLSHDWPGNIRELENVIEYSVNVTKNNCITFNDLPPLFKTTASYKNINPKDSLKTRVNNYELNMLIKGYDEIKKGNLTRLELAKQLSISRTSLYRKLKKLESLEEQ